MDNADESVILVKEMGRVPLNVIKHFVYTCGSKSGRTSSVAISANCVRSIIFFENLIEIHRTEGTFKSMYTENIIIGKTLISLFSYGSCYIINS